jgi:hypothetical protein
MVYCMSLGIGGRYIGVLETVGGKQYTAHVHI